MTDHTVNVIDQVPNNYSKNSVWDVLYCIANLLDQAHLT
jgi:hypothetical protein